MIDTKRHRYVAHNALDGFNISKQTLANAVLALCDEVDRLRAVQLKSDQAVKQARTPDISDIFGPIFGGTK